MLPFLLKMLKYSVPVQWRTVVLCEPAATVICVCLSNSSSWNLHQNVGAWMTPTVRSKVAVTASGLWEKCSVILLKEECGGEWVLDWRC